MLVFKLELNENHSITRAFLKHHHLNMQMRVDDKPVPEEKEDTLSPLNILVPLEPYGFYYITSVCLNVV